MSGIGKTTSGYIKQDYQESKLLALGFRKTRFAHQATAGATGLNFSSLVAPTAMSTNGFVQPSFGNLVAANIYTYSNNVSISSSLRGPLENNFDYQIVSNSQINFIGFSAAQDEVFVGKIDPVNLIGNLVVDGTAQPTTGILAVGATDFNVGFPFSINLYPSAQIGAYTYYRNGRVQVRNANNSPTGTGNYYEVPVVGGLGYIARFNVAGALLPDGSNETIVAIPTGLLVERPQNSMLASIENIAGQLDQVIPTVAALAGVPTTTFQTAPNNVDLKAFGDIVLGMLDIDIPYLTNWTPYTATLINFGGTPTQTCFWRQVGESVEIKGFITCVAGMVGSPVVSIPSQFEFDYTKIPNTTSFMGVSRANQSGNVYLGDMVTNSGSPTQIGLDGPNGQSNWSTTVPFTWGAGDTVQFLGSAPMLGLSATRTIRSILGL